MEEVSPVKKTKSIEQYDLDGNLIKVWDSINSIENGTDYKGRQFMLVQMVKIVQRMDMYGSIVDNKLCLMSELLL